MASTKKGNNLEEFRQSFDRTLIVPQKIKAGLDQLGNAWEREGDFIKRCGVNQTDFGRFREQFEADHVVEVLEHGRGVRRRVWAGTKALARQLREIINK